MARLHIALRNLSTALEWADKLAVEEETRYRKLPRRLRTDQLEASERRTNERRKEHRQLKFNPRALQ
jgi:hypothetical protein